MANYDNGIETREKILAACRILFYQKGYVKTTFTEICKFAQINQGSIYYHFKTKKNIGKIIFTEAAMTNYNIASKYFAEKNNDLVLFIVSFYIYWHLFFVDKQYREFCLACFVEMFLDSNDEYFKIFFRYFDIFICNLKSNDEIKYGLITASCFGIDSQLCIHVYNNIEKLSFDKVAEYNLEMYFKLFEIQEVIYSKAICEAKELFNTIEFKNDGFNLSAKLRSKSSKINL